MLKFLFASDSFKGTLSSEETAEMLTVSAKEVFGSVECKILAMADGGEGTAAAVIKAIGGKLMEAVVSGPLGHNIKATWGRLPGDRAIIEMASASGLPLVPPEQRNPLHTTTFGTGQLIKAALDEGIRDFYIAIGGSATNDGGMGCMEALGIRFLNKQGHELHGKGSSLAEVENIDVSQLDNHVKDARFTVMCDVTSPLCGKNGATYTFSAQKGATPKIQDLLEAGMCHYRDCIIRQFNINPDNIAGSGAAGGLGAALLVFLNAKLMSGIETVLNLTDFDNLIKDVDLVVTGEGKVDGQSCHGKVMQGIGKHCEKMGIPAIALVGCIDEGADNIINYGIRSLNASVASPITLEEALGNAKANYMNAARRMFRMIKVGYDISQKTKS